MAKFHLSEDDVRTLKQVVRRVGAGKTSERPWKRRRGRGGGGSGASTKAQGMITDTIPAAAFSGANKEVTPGISTGNAVTVLKWNTAGDKMVEDTDAGAMQGRNVTSLTQIRASVDEPVVLAGEVVTIDEQTFFVPDPFDLRALPGHIKGDPPAGSDDPDLVIVHSKGGSDEYTVSSAQCDGP